MSKPEIKYIFEFTYHVDGRLFTKIVKVGPEFRTIVSAYKEAERSVKGFNLTSIKIMIHPAFVKY